MIPEEAHIGCASSCNSSASGGGAHDVAPEVKVTAMYAKLTGAMAAEKIKATERWALVVDDHPLFCDALVLTLSSLGLYSRIRTADCLEVALTTIRENTLPDLIVLDLNLPDVSGLDGLLRLRHLAAPTPVVVVSSLADNRVIAGALAAGAAGFIPKHSSRAVIGEALGLVRSGEVFVPPGFDAPSGTPELAEAGARLASLTQQQARILTLICEGKLNKQIAFDLSIAETTVKAHMTAIMRKLGVQSRTQAVLVAQAAQLDGSLPKN